MAGLNKVMLIGNLGDNPRRGASRGKTVVNMRVATSSRWTNDKGERKEETQWHDVVVWGRTAENCLEYLEKGRQVFIEGRLQTRQYLDRDGNKRYTTEVVAKTVQFLGGAKNETP